MSEQATPSADEIGQAVANDEVLGLMAADMDDGPSEGGSVDPQELFEDALGSDPDALLAATLEGDEIDSEEGTEDPTDALLDGEETSEDKEASEEEGDDTGANKRIRSLVEEKNAYKGQIETLQNQSQEQLRQMQYQFEQSNMQQQQHFQQQLQAMQQQNELLTRQVSQIADAREEEDLSYADKFRRDTLRQAENQIGSQFDQKFQTMQQQYDEKFAALEREKQEIEQRQEMQRIYNKYTAEADNAAKGIIDSHKLDPETGGEIQRHLSDFVLTAAASAKLSPSETAEATQKLLDRYFRARVKGLMATRKAAVTKNQEAPKAPTATATHSSAPTGTHTPFGKSLTPTQYEEVKLYYDDLIEARRDNFKRVYDARKLGI